MNFLSFSGIVTMISDFPIRPNDQGGCYRLLSVDDGRGNMGHFDVNPDPKCRFDKLHHSQKNNHKINPLK